jgi:hypothetical protein
MASRFSSPFGGGCPVAHGGSKLTGTCPVSHNVNNSTMGDAPPACLARVEGGLDLTLIVDTETPQSVPLSNIPNSISVREFKELLRMAAIAIKEEQSWDRVQLYLDSNHWHAIPDQISLGSAGVQSGQTLYLSYQGNESAMLRGATDKHSSIAIKVLIPGEKQPVVFNHLPPYASIAGLKNELKPKLRGNFQQLNIKSFDGKIPLPDTFPLNKLVSDILLLEADSKVSLKKLHPYCTVEFWQGLLVGVLLMLLLLLLVNSKSINRLLK